MNRDLKEKGLRLPGGQNPRSRPHYEPRPEREGIKTPPQDRIRFGYPMNRDLKEKGLRQDHDTGTDSVDAMNRDLKEKGLRRPGPNKHCRWTPYEPRPEREGIKTPCHDCLQHGRSL